MVRASQVPPPIWIGTKAQFGDWDKAGDWEHCLSGSESDGDLFGDWLARGVLQLAEMDMHLDEFRTGRYLSTILLWAEQAVKDPSSVPGTFWQGLIRPHLDMEHLAYSHTDFRVSTERIRRTIALAPSSDVLAVFQEYAPDDWSCHGVDAPGELQEGASREGFALIRAEVALRAASDLGCRAATTPFIIGESVEKDDALKRLAVRMLLAGLTPPLPMNSYWACAGRDEESQMETQRWTAGVISQAEGELRLESPAVVSAYHESVKRWAKKERSRIKKERSRKRRGAALDRERDGEMEMETDT
ncbi:MAG: hypothetical protein WDW38_006653 [Sanguina aurantia]